MLCHDLTFISPFKIYHLFSNIKLPFPLYDAGKSAGGDGFSVLP